MTKSQAFSRCIRLPPASPPSRYPERERILYKLISRSPPLLRAQISGELALLIELTHQLREEGEFFGGPTTTGATVQRCELRLISAQTIALLMADNNSQAEKLLPAVDLLEPVSGEKNPRYPED